jgi:hypothetical protein
MGVLAHLLFWPVTGPLFLVKFSLDKVQRLVQEELTDDGRIKAELLELQLAHELGDIDDAEYLVREAEVMEQLREVREWREYFGMPLSGGVVRMAPSETAESDAAPDAATGEDAAAADDAARPRVADPGSGAIIELNFDWD